MEAVIFTGIQGSGKSTFYKERFFATHVRINLDMVRTRRREDILLNACIQAGQRFVVDNTNPTPQVRSKYIALARGAHFRVIGYYFASGVADSLARNALREGKARVPNIAILGTYKRLEPPTYEEGFDELYTVHIAPSGEFIVNSIAASP